jgi:signal transduction histidine kinase
LAQRLGLAREELASRPLHDWIHPDDRAELERARRQPGSAVIARHAARDSEWIAIAWRLRTEGGREYALGRPATSTSGRGEQPRREVSARSSMGRMLDAMARIVEAKNPGMRCSILLINRDSNCVRVGAGPSLPAEYNAAVEGLHIGPAVGSCGTAAYWDVAVVVEDIGTDPLWRDLREAAQIAGVGACWSHPIRATNGDVLGAMALYASTPSRPAQYQMDALEIAAHMVGLAVERENLQAQLRQAAKMEALGVMAGGIAHDFNNLLGVILGNAELMRDDLTGVEVQSMLADVIGAARSATGLCQQLLAYAGRGAIAIETVDVNTVIRELLQLVHVTLSKKASLRHDLGAGMCVTADASQLRQVLLNLVTNAAEAIGNQQGEVVVLTRSATSVTAEVPHNLVEIVVSDNGCGMHPETQQRIFDPFFSTKAEGRGLGLAAVKGIVDAHGWDLSVRSTPGSGSVFTLRMPRVLPDPAPPAPRPARTEAAPARILVVDDEPGMCKVVSRVLERAGMQVVQAADGAQAIARFRDEAATIDCVVLDLNMPRLDGQEVFAELRRIRPDARVLLMSGFAEQEVLDRFRDSGLAGVVQKPVSAAVLLQKVSATVASGR